MSSLSASQPVVKRNTLDFDTLHTEQLHFPQDLLWGFAIAEQQNSWDNLPVSQWTRWGQTTWPNGKPHIKDGMLPGVANDHWNKYEEDIALMHNDFGANAFRFSLAWDRIEPEMGTFDEEALKHYSDEVDACLAKGIQPMITLHHFAHPIWFEDMGAFEKEENLRYFVRYARKVFEVLGDRVTFWNTINEPTIYVFQGYLPADGSPFPPGKGFGNPVTVWSRANRVLRNMMQAHTEVYQALKSMKHGQKAQIGLVHQYLKFEPYSTFDPIENAPALAFNDLTDSVIRFLKTGKFSIGTPGFTRATYEAHTNQLGDFVGLNFYSRVTIKFSLFSWPPNVDSAARPGEVMTDMKYVIHPQSFYNAIHHMNEIGLPIYITENGVPDDQVKNDVRRVKWIKEYLKAASLAIEDGVNLKGFFWWTLMDNFEWNCGWHCQFGMYTKDRQIKEGAQLYADIIRKGKAGELEAPTEDFIEDKEAYIALQPTKRGVSLWKATLGILGAYIGYKFFTDDTVSSYVHKLTHVIR